MTIKKKTFASLVSLSLVLSFSLMATSSKVNAGMDSTTANDVGGYAWSDNIGWISFSCVDTNSCSTVQYGVDMNTTTGALSGYAWSDNIGWIDFSGASVDLTSGKVIGWAQVLSGSGRTDGWDGKISLSTQTGDSVSYGVTYNKTTQQFSGFAWGSDVVGWISFNQSDTGSSVNYYVYGPGGTGIPPSVPSNLSASAWCDSNSPALNISYTENTGTLPITYHIYRQTSSWGSFTNEFGETTGTTYSDSGLSLNTTYYYKIKASNAYGDSALSGVISGTTSSNCAPATPVELKTFIATPPIGNKGYTCTLSWQLQSYNNNTSCSLTGSGLNVSYDPNAPGNGSTGSYAVTNVQGESPYTFSCTDVGTTNPTVSKNATCHINSDFKEEN